MTNTISKKPSAAGLLHRRLAATPAEKPQHVADSFAEVIGRRLESRGITRVPGLPEPEAPQWYDLAIESHRRHQEFEAQREAKQQADLVAAQPTPDLIRSTIAGAASPMPLNGAGVLRAALSGVGGSGTVNGQ